MVYENQTEGTSPVAYLPQVLALLIGRLFTDSPAALAYLQEVMLATIWIVGMTVVIRIVPFGKWPLLLIALLPTQIQDSFQLGADVHDVAAVRVHRRIADTARLLCSA